MRIAGINLFFFEIKLLYFLRSYLFFLIRKVGGRTNRNGGSILKVYELCEICETDREGERTGERDVAMESEDTSMAAMVAEFTVGMTGDDFAAITTKEFDGVICGFNGRGWLK